MLLVAKLDEKELKQALSHYVGLCIYDGSFDPEVIITSIGPDTGVDLVVIVGDMYKGGETDREEKGVENE